MINMVTWGIMDGKSKSYILGNLLKDNEIELNESVSVQI